MNADALRAARPSRTERFSGTILLFSAIRRGDDALAAELIGRDPTLVSAVEDWTVAEALDAGLLYVAKAPPLVRAAQRGSLAMVRLLVEAGAPVAGRFARAGGESPLWAATLAGAADVVAYLLGTGADPNAAAFAGATPLHVAVQRHHTRITRLLLAGGADPGAVDAHGRTPGDWAAGASDGVARASGDAVSDSGGEARASGGVAPGREDPAVVPSGIRGSGPVRAAHRWRCPVLATGLWHRPVRDAVRTGSRARSDEVLVRRVRLGSLR